MEFQQVVDRRRMVRRFTDEPVEAAVVDRAIRNATHAPNAGFSQGWEFVVLDTPADTARFWRATTDLDAGAEPDRWLAGLMTAPVIVIPCSDRSAYVERYAEPDKGWSDESRWAMPYWHLDTAMASLLVLLTAVDAGLGACFFGLPVDREPTVRTTFALPDRVTPIGVVALGHPDPGVRRSGSPQRRARRPLDEVLHRGGWAH